MNQQQKYQSSTLKSHNQYRIKFLPCFPTSFASSSSSSSTTNFLLSSVPNQLLSTNQVQCRQEGAYDRPFQYKILGNKPSFLNFIYRYVYQHLGERLHIDEAIIDYNLTRLDEAMVTIAIKNDLQQKSTEELDIAFDISQLAIALEIFLQTDVDMLYMKTCSYRGAQPRIVENKYRTEGIFCVEPPEARYGLLPCTREQCRHCLENRHLTRRSEPTVVYHTSQYYKFLNGYQVILNCPATCTTANIIYVLTCPCHHYEYIGTTKMAFSDRLWRHHEHGTRIMHEFLMGTTIINHTLTEPKSAETIAKDRMRLYRHSTLCGTAMQMFLDCNPQYWCCVPMKHIDAQNEDGIYQQIPSTIHIIDGHHRHENTIDNRENIRGDEEIQWYMDNLPLPPAGYRFSQRQHHQQYLFFKYKQDFIMPSSHLDLYNATIIFVLPNNCSNFVRRFIESLLIIHTECNLNTVSQLAIASTVDNNQRRLLQNPLAHGLWYEPLVHPCYS